ncbi:MAG: TRAM domain-containing protein [archaeon]
MEYDNGNRGGFRQSFAPVKVGDEIDVTIESLGEKGDGIAKVNNFVIVVPGGKEGETVKVRITRVLRKVAFAEVIGEGQESTEETTEEEPEAEDDSEEETTEEDDSEEEEDTEE